MMTKSITNVDEIYLCCKKADINIHSITFPELRTLFISIDRFIRSLGEIYEDPFWYPKMRLLKRYRFDISAAPLTDVLLKRMTLDLFGTLKSYSSMISLMYPDFSSPYSNLLDEINKISNLKLDRLLEELSEVANKENLERSAIVIKESRLIPPVEKAASKIKSLYRCDIVNFINLREDVCYNHLFIIGPPSWYPDFIFTSPRARKLEIIKYSWIRGTRKLDNVFLKPLKQKGSVINISDIDDDVVINPDDLLPTLDISRIIADVKNHANYEEDDEYINARLFLLEGDLAVLLEADESSSVLVLDLDEDRSNSLIRVRTNDIEIGSFILLRTSGGGDYILPIANRIMEDYSDIARERQKVWKEKLRGLVRQYGIIHVVSELRQRGSTRANETNVRNWMSFRSIKTQDYIDFNAIMEFIGLNESGEDYWKTMEVIDRAHKSAGFHIRKLLLEKVKKSNLEKLERLGMMEFQIPDEDAGSITAFRIIAISDKVMQVSTIRIGYPFSADFD